MLNTLIQAFNLITTWEVIIAMLAASVYGLVIGSLPGLSATMATALLVPVTFYLSPIAAIAVIVAASTMAIFSGDIPGALLRIPGTPASAAYADEAYAMTRKGEAELASLVREAPKLIAEGVGAGPEDAGVAMVRGEKRAAASSCRKNDQSALARPAFAAWRPRAAQPIFTLPPGRNW